MSIIKEGGYVIPAQLRRVLNNVLAFQYKKRFIDGDLALTEQGERSLLNFLNTTKLADEWVEFEKKNLKTQATEAKEEV